MFRQSIYYFISVVDEGSFSAAGKKHYLSQSAISQQITKLESELGFPLFKRDKYRPVLTEEGKQFYLLCSRIVSEYNSEVDKISKINIAKQKTITVGITSPFEKKYIPTLVKNFKKEHDVTFVIKTFDLSECVGELASHRIDVGFGLVNDFAEAPEIISYNIYQSHVCIVAPSEHPIAKRDSVSAKEIAGEPIVVISRKIGQKYYRDYMNSFELDGVVPNIVKEVDNLGEFLMAIQLGEGIGLSAVEVITEHDEVAAVPLTDTHHHAHYAVGYSADCKRYIVKKFVEYIVDFFKEYK